MSVHDFNSLKPGVLIWYIGKQYSPRCDAAEHGTILYLLRGISPKKGMKF